ncbi:MAG: hypothetical protein D6714_16670, partial [Bacteroidetes bacterium]
NGTWNPAQIDPNGQGGNTITATFTPNGNECANQTTLDVDINAAVDPTFDPVGPLCETDAPVTLPTTSLEGINGTWNPAQIDPNGQGGNTITATFTPNGNECATQITIDVDINAEVTPVFDPVGPLCETDDPVTLPNTSTNSISGTWDSGNIFDPTGQGGQTVPLLFTPDAGQCAATFTLDIEVNAETTPTFTPIGDLCEDDAPVTLSGVSDDGITGSWNVGTSFDPTGMAGTTTTLTFTPDPGQCAGVWSENVTVHALPSMTEIAKDCNASLTDYFVTIQTSADSVAASAGMVTNNQDGTFTIDNIPAGVNISVLIVETTVGCQQPFFINAPSCNCPNIDPPTGNDVTICEDEPIPALTASVNGPYEIDWYDAPTGGTLLLENSTTFTPTQADTFYVEAVEASSDCTSSQRTAIALIILPVDTFFNNFTTCDPALAGVDTTVFQTSLCDSVVITTTTLLPSHIEFFSAVTCDSASAGTDTLLLSNQFGCDSIVITETTFQPAIVTVLPMTTCDPSLAGADTTIFQTANCDSIVIVETTLLPSDEVMTMTETCDPALAGLDTLYFTNQFGCDSVVILETVLSPSHEFFFTQTSCDPNDVGTDTLAFQNQFGCDSLIITQTTFSAADTTFDMASTCDPALVGTDTLVFNTPDCDSIVIVTIVLTPPSESFFTTTSCDPAQVGLDTLVLTGANNCDSLVITQTTLEPIPPVFNTTTTCDPDAAGLDTLILVSAQGCDSVVITQTDLLPSSLVMLSETSCDPNLVG